jgi:hypothetical protein
VVKAGGRTDDPHLLRLVNLFTPSALAHIPDTIDHTGSILPGTCVSFSRNARRDKLKVCVNGYYVDTIPRYPNPKLHMPTLTLTVITLTLTLTC